MAQTTGQVAADAEASPQGADGPAHKNTSGAGHEPLAADGVFDAPELLDAPRSAIVRPALSVAPHSFGLAALPRPFIEGPQRPPRVAGIPG